MWTQIGSAKQRWLPFILILPMLLLLIGNATAQMTAFTYQGKLNDTGNPANGQYDFQFKLFDTVTVGTGTQQGGTQTVPNMQVTAGIFAVQLDFGAVVFSGAPRFLEIAVKKTSDPTFTTLGPRQPVAASPYALHTLNADSLSVACVGCITSSQIQSVQGAQVTGAIAGSQVSGLIPVASVPAGSASYIQNGTAAQAAANFNIGGNGTIGGNLNVGGALSLNIVNAQTQYNLAGSRVLSNAGTNNLFAGVGAGLNNTTGNNNAFFGAEAGSSNTTSSGNAFFGYRAGLNNTAGASNSFFGNEAGKINTTGTQNAFFGSAAGINNTAGNNNAFFGFSAGSSNTVGNDNAFFGWLAGFSNAGASENSFFGNRAGASTTTGSSNTFFGFQAGLRNTAGGFNAFFGREAGFSNTTGGSNAFFGSLAGRDNTTGITNAFFGDAAGLRNTTGFNNVFIGAGAGASNTTGSSNTFIGDGANFNGTNTTGSSNTLLGVTARVSPGVSNSTAIGAGASVTTSNTIVLGTASNVVVISGLGAAGGFALCRNASNQISFCSSSLRYKTDVRTFTGGLDLVRRLRPITFTWKDGRMRDVGMVAEEVEAVEPLLTFRNHRGEVEGVKYDRVGAVLINAVKEQQAQIKQQQAQIKERERQAARQQQQIAQYRQQLLVQQNDLQSLKRLVCLSHPRAPICKTRRNAR